LYHTLAANPNSPSEFSRNSPNILDLAKKRVPR
jgi:hypothetical protein